MLDLGQKMAYFRHFSPSERGWVAVWCLKGHHRAPSDAHNAAKSGSFFPGD